MEVFMIYKISPHPSFPKRGIQEKVYKAIINHRFAIADLKLAIENRK
jgi:hypothetical protein